MGREIRKSKAAKTAIVRPAFEKPDNILLQLKMCCLQKQSSRGVL